MSNLCPQLIDEIVKKCIETYIKLHKNGKPAKEEWTVLSCVVQYDKFTSNIVSLGTGTKCIGASKMSPKGDLLNDSHAEVFARRGFLVYIYDNMEKALDGKCSIFTFENNKFKLKDNIQFFFYSSQLPCGDASIIPMTDSEDDIGEVISTNKRQAEDDICDLNRKKIKESTATDVHRTGAKCLPNSIQDLKCPGRNYHSLGQVRIKPGRGDRTLSVSCSDKMARWIHLGIQGALLNLLLHKPIYVKFFIFGAGVPYTKESVERAFFKRDSQKTITLECVPQIYQSSVVFPQIKKENNLRPAPSSIVWINLNHGVQEVAVLGRKLGLTKKKASSPVNSLCISKYQLYKRFQSIILKKNLNQSILSIDNIEIMPYNVMKIKSRRYMEKWAEIKQTFFKTWTVKPDIFNFCVNMM